MFAFISVTFFSSLCDAFLYLLSVAFVSYNFSYNTVKRIQDGTT